jgi:hypothetical protein
MKHILLLLLICTFSASAQVLHFDTVGCGVDVADTSYINKMVRHEGQFYNQVFSTHINDFLKVNVNLYGNDRTYIRAVKANNSKAFTNGLYLADINQCFVFKNDFYIHVILHAASLNLLHSNYPNAPRWLTEGFASIMSYIDEGQDRDIVYTPLFDYNKQIQDLSWNRGPSAEAGLDFDALFMENNPDWDKRGGTANAVLRALSYGVVYFLVTHEKAHLAPIITSMKEGHTATEAIASSYGTFDDFKDRFTFYYKYAAKSKFSAADSR